MNLRKENVCVFIENEEHLKKSSRLLQRYKEKIANDSSFGLSGDISDWNYLYFNLGFKNWGLGRKNGREITLSELETILMNQ